MRYRPLGKTGIQVSEVGFGAWGIGGVTPGATSYGPTDDDVSRRALETAFDCGITFYDTANVYGAGRSERLIGETFRNRRDRVVIATKVGAPDYTSQPDFSIDALQTSVSGSLKRLHTDYIDLLQLHNPDPSQFALDDTFRGLEDLRTCGLVRAIGVSLRTPNDGFLFLDRYDIDAIQVNLNLLDQRANDCGLLGYAETAQIAVIARTPLCFGFLADTTISNRTFDAADHRSTWTPHQIRQWSATSRALDLAISAPQGEPLARLALRYCLAYSAVTSVIPGILTPEEARQNAGVGSAEPLSSAVLSEIRRIYANQPPFKAKDRSETASPISGRRKNPQ